MGNNRMLTTGLISGAITLGSTAGALHFDKERKKNPNYVAASTLNDAVDHISDAQGLLTYREEPSWDADAQQPYAISHFPNASAAKIELNRAYSLAESVAESGVINQDFAQQTSQANAGLAELLNGLVPARIERTEDPTYATQVASLDNTIDTYAGLASNFKLQAPVDETLALGILAVFSAGMTVASMSQYARSGRRREDEIIILVPEITNPHSYSSQENAFVGGGPQGG